MKRGLALAWGMSLQTILKAAAAEWLHSRACNPWKVHPSAASNNPYRPPLLALPLSAWERLRAEERGT